MRQTKWWISVLLVLMVAVVSACGRAPDTTGQDTDQNQNQALPPTEAPDTAQEEDTDSDAAPAGDPTEAEAVATEGDVAQPATPSEFKESPKLAGGNLPAVQERLPKQPMVLQPVKSVGKHGGTWNTALKGTSDTAWLVRTIGYENLVRWKPNVKNFTADEIIPNIAESVDMNEDGSEYTFHLREGMKWSDGKPFTADDIMFWYEDVLSNEELTPSVPSWLTAADKPVTVERVDDVTVVFKFAGPSGLFLSRLATPVGEAPTNYPRHYLQQFHKKYNPQVEAQAKQAQLDSWADLFTSKVSAWENPDKPVLNAWQLTKAVGDATQQLTAERNPYYWKVDTEGNQLPYIDTVAYRVTDDVEVMVLQALNGEIDFMDRHINALANKPVFFENQEKGNYHF
ncbi:MAG: ABC transporter substrate-binding protein, partial [Chloroflexota bacterium]|nr:ABC transporter substrate-binding protein [Chloroflexota bacterium]